MKKFTLQLWTDDLQAEADLMRSVCGTYLQEGPDKAHRTYRAVENGQQVFDQELVVIVRADTNDELRHSDKQVQAALREQPAQLDPKTVICTRTAPSSRRHPSG